MGRGRKGSGVEVHGDKIRIRFTFQGKRYAEPLDLAATAPNLKAAARFAAEVRQKIALGVFDHAEAFPGSKHVAAPETTAPVTVKAYAERWEKTLTGEKSTLDGYKSQINNFWLPAVVDDAGGTFGDLVITEVRHTHVATAIAAKAKAGITGKTTNNLLIPMRGMFEAAIADGLVDASPVSKVKNRRHQKPPPDPFDLPEMLKILDHMEGHYPQVITNYFMFAFGTGVRPSEEIMLPWAEIDWNRLTAMVKAARVRHQAKGTKTNKVREVDLNDMAITALTRQKAHTFMKGPKTPIFCNPEGLPWLSERRLREDFFHPALRACGIRLRKAYCTRHTYATLNLMAGVNPTYLATQLGHADAQMLFKHYAKWIKGADQGREAEKSRAVFGPNMAHAKIDAN
jgi:integrase